MRRLTLLLLVGVLMVTVPAVAQQFPTLERGFAPNKYFSFGDIDSINTFNGNLSLQIPIGPAYPVNGGFSYRLSLVYNSKVWDYELVGGSNRAVPNRDSNAGMGWTLVPFGQLASPSDSSNPQPGDEWNFMGADGNRHLIADKLHPQSAATTLSGIAMRADYSHAGEYLRMLTNSDGTTEVDSPDGIARSLHTSSGFPTSMSDPFGNSITISSQSGTAGTPCPAGDAAVWVISDSGHVNTQYICLQSSAYPESAFAGQMIERIVLKMPAGQTGTYQFAYTPLAISRGCSSNYPNDVNPIPNVPMLASVTLPDGSAYAFGYNQNTVNGCEQGTLAALTLPTQATYSYAYREYAIPSGSCDKKNFFNDVVGVGSKTVSGPGLQTATWTYSSSPSAMNEWVQCAQENGTIQYRKAPADEMVVAITDPNGDVTEHYYSTWPGAELLYKQNPDLSFTPDPNSTFFGPSENGALVREFGLPFSRRSTRGSRFLSTRRYTAAGYAAAPKTSLRSEYVTYEYDIEPCLQLDARCLGSNQRPTSNETVYEDDGNRTADTNETDFDGLGHYRSTATDGSFLSGNVRTSKTDYNSGVDANGNMGSAFAFASNDRWLLGTFGDQWTSESSHTSKTEHCFNPQTGFLKAKRVLLGDASDVSGISQSANDILMGFTNDGHGNVAREQYFGGDTCGTAGLIASCTSVPSCAPVGVSICDAVASATVPTYDIHHSYSNGVLTTSQYFQCDDVTPVSFKSVDRTIDAVGVVTNERDTAGNQTSYTYDTSGRVKAIAPPGETQIAYSYANASSTNNVLTPATVTATRGTVEADYQFDALGRLWREKHLLPDVPNNSTTWSLRETTYDTLGRQQFVSGFETIPGGANPPNEPGFHPAHTTQFTYDTFGRPLSATAPDAEATTFAYTGVSTTKQTVNIATGSSEASVTTTETFDRQGRMTSITEGDGAAGAVTAGYGYDVGNRLNCVWIPGNASQPTNCQPSGGVQTRAFSYDNRGLLTTEVHPELGAMGYGAATNKEYDPRGHSHRNVTGSDNGPFDVRTADDAAERPTTVTDVAQNHLLKQFAYDGGFACTGTTCNGKVAAALRYNYDPDLGAVAVTESYQYDAATGRPSRRDRTNGLTGETFFFTETYNALGDVDTLTYPCRSTGCDRTRKVQYGYTNGFLTSVSPSPSGTAWASSITYQPTGLISTIQHGGGSTATWSPDPNGMSRPQSISATDSTNQTVWSTGTYLYDGAGNIKQIGTTNYTYDILNRFASSYTGVLTGSYNRTRNAYDAFGNRLYSIDDSCGFLGGKQRCVSSNPFPIAVRGTTNHYAAWTYDAAGNVTTDGDAKRSYSYGPLSMMAREVASGRDFRFLYTADDERIAAVERVNGTNAVTTTTIRGFGGQLLSVWTGSTWKEDEIFRGAELLANESAASGTRHYFLDHLGSPRRIANASGVMIGSQDFAPFGSGGTSDGGALQFTGQERDAASLAGGTAVLADYFHMRFEDSVMGRFLSLDKVSGSPGNPQSWNRYAYVRNNPLNMSDPTGMKPKSDSHTHCGFETACAEDIETLASKDQTDTPLIGEPQVFDPNDPMLEVYAFKEKLHAAVLITTGTLLDIVELFDPSLNTTIVRSAANDPTRNANLLLAAFRLQLYRLTGLLPAGSQAHHIFPRQFAEQFEDLGIKWNSAEYGAWWKTSEHLSTARKYNKIWQAFLRRNPTREEALVFGKGLAESYGLKVLFKIK